MRAPHPPTQGLRHRRRPGLRALPPSLHEARERAGRPTPARPPLSVGPGWLPGLAAPHGAAAAAVPGATAG